MRDALASHCDGFASESVGPSVYRQPRVSLLAVSISLSLSLFYLPLISPLSFNIYRAYSARVRYRNVPRCIILRDSSSHLEIMTFQDACDTLCRPRASSFRLSAIMYAQSRFWINSLQLPRDEEEQHDVYLLPRRVTPTYVTNTFPLYAIG